MFHSMNALFHRNHWLNFIPMVAVVSSKPPRKGAVGSNVSSGIRFLLFWPPTQGFETRRICLFVFWFGFTLNARGLKAVFAI